ncbi:MAG: diphosphomevalonate decarboxylase [Myxococcales bacterium]|nr:diphosphomevalonate decarboxylase [Myxococcales bacterium]
MKARAFAHTNIALIKYWGKRDLQFNLPATDSLSLTLKAFGTETEVSLHDGTEDELILNGEKASPTETQRVAQFLELVREQSVHASKARVTSLNQVPTAAGLASSASAFAALALAAVKAYELDDTSTAQLSRLARQGSGSAARSIFGGLVHMRRGTAADGHDALAYAIPNTSLQLGMLVVPCHQGPKAVSSTKGMTHTEQTSPYFESWCATHDADMNQALNAIAENDFVALGEAMEHSTLKMHATALTAKPGLWYWNAETWRVIESIQKSRSEECPFYFTMDAGPHVKVLVQQNQMDVIKQKLCEALDRAPENIWQSLPGGPARWMDV